MLAEGQQIELVIEKPAAGGRMIARHLGQVVLVRGAIPGERVTAWVERAEKRLAYAVTREVLEPSPDRRDAPADPLCGGALYSHIAYPRQLAIKSDVIRDAFARLGRHPLEQPIDVAPSREDGYRMRARFHVRGARAGFYREGTHQLCDAGPTGQMLPATVAALLRVAHVLEPTAPVSISITENIAGTERAAFVELAGGSRLASDALARARDEGGLSGISARAPEAAEYVAGQPVVQDTMAAISGGRVTEGALQRHAESFFQGNRYLLASLVTAVLDTVPPEGEVLDLYAGVGLFSVALAASGHLEVTGVETDRAAGRDLRHNAQPLEPGLRVSIQRVEDYLRSRRGGAARTVLVDPPRTGLSPEAMDAIVRHAAPTIVYVSCDPATLARDTRRLLDAGYALASVRAFDLFPNTPHVETLAVFERSRSGSP